MYYIFLYPFAFFPQTVLSIKRSVKYFTKLWKVWDASPKKAFKVQRKWGRRALLGIKNTVGEEHRWKGAYSGLHQLCSMKQCLLLGIRFLDKYKGFSWDFLSTSNKIWFYFTWLILKLTIGWYGCLLVGNFQSLMALTK